MSSGNASKRVSEFDLDPALDIEWEALDGILFDGVTLPEQEEEDCIRINPISSNFSLSQKTVHSSSAKSRESIAVAPLSSFATTNISSYLDRSQVYPPSVPSFPTSYPSYAPQDTGEVHYPGSAGNSKKSVEFEEFLKTPAARELFEGSPSYSFSSIGTIEAAPVNRKTKREEAFGTSSYDDEDADGIKAMRGGSLGRVIASSVAAGTIVGLDANARLFSGDGQTVNPSVLQQAVGIIPNGTNNVTIANGGLSKEEERKQLVSRFFQRLNRCDVSGLVQIIRHCDEVCVLSTPDVLDPIIGRSDIMMLISLYIEAYPDGVWTPSAISLVGDTASCTYRFMGTRVFDHPINTLYRQIKTHMGTIMAASSQHHQIDFFANAMDAQRLVNEVAESAVPIDSHHTHSSSEPSGSHDQASAWQEQQQETNQPIMFRRRSRSLREVKAIETVVLEEGPTTYRRKLEFIFNEYNEIVQILYTNIL